MAAPHIPSVDSRRTASLSFAPPALPDRTSPALTPLGSVPVPVGPGRPASPAPMLAAFEAVTGYPIQIAKVQPPPLRGDTLARPRLLEWLQAKIHDRLVLVVAEAGYGKTTLLADFSKRTRVRTLWYRLDELDRGWAPFLAHLVAAGRQHDPAFAPATHDLLEQLGPGGPSRESVVNAFLRELPALAGEGAAIILDDFHLVDDADEVRELTRELLARAPERVTILISSRRRPALPIARLRSLGEVAELTSDDLRFDVAETASLFRDAYRHPLDPETVAELTERTEGWAASLQLVEAATRGRGARETRAFIRSLSGAEGELYDYLAEEVVGHLAPEMQRFLMRTSLLETVDPELAAVVAGVDVAEARSLIATAERFGLLSRRGGSRGVFRFHPLVQEFLRERLSRDEDSHAVAAMHRTVGRAAEESNWYVACVHYAAAGDSSDVERVLKAAIPKIMALGQYPLAARFVDDLGSMLTSPTVGLILSRLALARDDFATAQTLARQALTSPIADELALGNLVSVLVSTASFEEARDRALVLAASASDDQLRQIARLTAALIESSVAGQLPGVAIEAEALASKCRTAGSRRYEGVALLNAGEVYRAIGKASEALRSATEAHQILETGYSPDLGTTNSIRGWALAHKGDLPASRAELAEARLHTEGTGLVEILSEFAAVEAVYGDAEMGWSLVSEAERIPHVTSQEIAEKLWLARVQLALRSEDSSGASTYLNKIRPRALSGVPGRESWRLCLVAHLAVLNEDRTAGDTILEARLHAARQGSSRWTDYADALDAVRTESDELDMRVQSLLRRSPSAVTTVAELALGRIDKLSHLTVQLLSSEIAMRPERWRQPLRNVVSNRNPGRILAARLLDGIGTVDDIGSLRRVAKSQPSQSRDRLLGKNLARRLAPRVFVEDQGKVIIRLGDRTIPSRLTRRKALALLCFLLTRDGFTAARDEILDALWPEVAPEDALNSLNQTIYFLRRVFEPGYAEDLSPEYVHNDSELVWLDNELVTSRSAECARLLLAFRAAPTREEVATIVDWYRGRFALDFLYEDWAAAHRDTQHAAYLDAVENGIRLDIHTADFRGGILLARRALAIDPGAQQIEQALLRLYRMAGAHAAAGEQYGHYAAAIRADLDIEPPSLEALEGSD